MDVSDERSDLEKMSRLNNELVTLQRELNKKNAELEKTNKALTEAIEHIKKLEDILSICSYCKKVKDTDAWTGLEQYLQSKVGTIFTHGICADCLEVAIDDIKSSKSND